MKTCYADRAVPADHADHANPESGYLKRLRVNYSVEGGFGTEMQQEADGFLGDARRAVHGRNVTWSGI
jgi:hypothetical protein